LLYYCLAAGWGCSFLAGFSSTTGGGGGITSSSYFTFFFETTAGGSGFFILAADGGLFISFFSGYFFSGSGSAFPSTLLTIASEDFPLVAALHSCCKN
jgi:hypothetical protein